MASFSSATRELVLKLVYYGPGLGGKTTTLKSLYAAVRAEHRGKMISLATPVDRTLYFDFLPVRLPSVGDLQLRLQLFTVPGQVYFNATRKLVLTGADGIVFVADSQEARLDADIESLDNLRDNLAELGRPFESVPIVLAYNKRDLPDILSVDELDEKLNPHGFPSLATSATSSRGVFETLDATVRLALDDLRRRAIIPMEVAIPADGLIAERLKEVREADPRPLEPTRIVSNDGQRTLSGTMQAVSTSDSTSRFPLSGSAQRHNTGIALTTPAPPLRGGDEVPSIVPAAAPIPREMRAAAERAPGTPSVRPGATHVGTSARSAGSMVALFDAEDHDSVRTIEEAIGEAIYARAVLLVESALVRVLERAGRAMGRADAAAEGIAWALSLPPERYGRVRSIAQRARRGGEVSRREALESFVLLATAQLAASALR